MNSKRVYDLADCSEYRQTVLAQPPRVVRATVLLLMVLVASAVSWAAWTQADLVVRATGRVRPMTAASNLPNAAAEESEISPLRGGRVTALHVREGDRIEQGALLLRLNTERIENDVTKQRRTIQIAEDELTRLDESESLLKQRFETAQAKADAELAHAGKDIETAENRRDAEIRAATAALDAGQVEWERTQQLVANRVATSAKLAEADARVAEARLRLEQAQLPIPTERLLVLKHARELVIRDHAVERTQLEGLRQQKRTELEKAKLELANLEWELAQSELRAPSSGTVTALNVSVGEVVEAGQSLMVMIDQVGFRMDLNVVSEDVGHLEEGLPVRVKLDAYDYQKYGTLTGRVLFIAPDSEFDSAAEKQKPPAYTVKVALDDHELIRGEHRGRIKLGMTGTAEIVVEQESLLSLLFRSFRQSISLG